MARSGQPCDRARQVAIGRAPMTTSGLQRWFYCTTTVTVAAPVALWVSLTSIVTV